MNVSLILSEILGRDKRESVVIMMGTVPFTKEEEYVLRLKEFSLVLSLRFSQSMKVNNSKIMLEIHV